MSFWSKLGVGLGFAAGGLVGGGIAMKIASNKNKRDNDRFLTQLQSNPAMQAFVAARFPGALNAIYGMNDSQVAQLRHAWEGSPMRRLTT